MHNSSASQRNVYAGVANPSRFGATKMCGEGGRGGRGDLVQLHCRQTVAVVTVVRVATAASLVAAARSHVFS